MSVGERVWRTEQRPYLRLLPQAIGVSSRGRSKRLERVLTDFGCEHSFQQAAARVLEHYGFEINVSAVRDATLEHASQAEQLLEKEYEQSFRVLPAVGAEQVVAQADGSMVCTVAAGARKGKRPRQWKEIRLAAAQALGSTETFYAATFGEVEEVGRRWGHCARRAGRGLNSQIHALGDGAEWIRLQTREVFGTQGTFLCDFFHVGGYLAEAAPSCRAQAPERWRRTQQDRLKRGALTKVLEALGEHLEPTGTAEELAPVNNAHRYLTNRTDCLDYARGSPLGVAHRLGHHRVGPSTCLAGSAQKSGSRLARAQCRENRKSTGSAGQWSVADPVELITHF